MGHWLWFHLGLDGTGPWYAWWSGSGSDLGEFALLGAVVGLVKHHNCHARRCWRLGRHMVDGTPYKVCPRHHPEVPDGGATVEQIHAAHREQAR